MYKFLSSFALVFVSVFLFSFPVNAFSGYDLAVNNVEIVSCDQGDDPPSFDYQTYLDGQFGEDSTPFENYEMLEIADDESWFRFAEHNNSDFGDITYKVVCLKVDIEADGDFQSLGETASDSYPTTFDDYFDYLPSTIQSAVVLVPSTPMPTDRFIPFYYQSGGIDQIYSSELEETNTFYTSIKIEENSLNPDDSFDLIVMIDNDFSADRGLFNRTFFDGVRHYNNGPVINETDETNNIYYVKDFLEPWMDGLPAPNVSITSASDNDFTVVWDAVDGAESYFVGHWKKHLSTLNEEWVSTEKQSNLSYEAILADGENYIDCIFVVPLGADNTSGKKSDDICMGNFFSDVDEGLWYTDYTHNAVQNGMISGYADSDGNVLGTFGPADAITTAQALKMVAILNDRFVDPTLFAFDLPYSLPSNLEGHWANQYILSASILGFDLVDNIGSLNPDRNITRAEMINLIIQSMEVEVPHFSSYSFTDIASNKYANEIELAHQLGIVSGYGGTSTFGPDNPLLRAEAVKVFVKAGNAFTLTWPGYEF